MKSKPKSHADYFIPPPFFILPGFDGFVDDESRKKIFGVKKFKSTYLQEITSILKVVVFISMKKLTSLGRINS